jgi:Ca-activated chloride channel family protein
MRMEAAWIWLTLPVLLVWVGWLARKSYAHLSPAARRASVLLRIAVLVLLLGAISRPVWLRAADGQHVIFLLDASRSVDRDNIEAAMADIDRLARDALGRGSAHRISLIAFGERPRLLLGPAAQWDGWNDEQRDLLLHETILPDLHTQRAGLLSRGATSEELAEIDRRIAAVESFRTQVAGDHTDARAALRLALNCGGTGDSRVLYLFTDANFTRGDWAAALDSALAAGCEVHTVAMDRPAPPEVAAAELSVPADVRVNQAFSADLRIASTTQTDARIAVFRDGYAVAEFAHALRPGDNTVRIPGLYFRDKGFHTVEVAVRAAEGGDTRAENNTVRSLVIVPGELRVLYVDADEGQQSYLSGALQLEGVRVETRPASGVPQSLDDLLGFDAMILSNVPADRLSMRQMQMIKTYVQDFGGGFIMLGGDQSFGLGGYFNTPIEEILPVRMPIQKDLSRPSLAIVLVIDKSGSMDGVKIQLAKRAAVATAEVINPRDQIAVIGFDSDARVILELTPAGDRAAITSAIAELDANGGTFLFPALEEAYGQLQASNARRKHVIILSDGQTNGFGYPDLANMMAAEGITVSTVGIGEDVDERLMEEIAAAGGGRSYFTNDFYSIPQIFTREALRASNSMLVERLVLPAAIDEDESIEEIDGDNLPPLAGYVATTPRDAARTIIISDSGDPILARWRTGLGRTAAFTSDTKPRWAEDWIRWEDFAKFWAQLVRSVAGEDVGRDVAVEATYEVRDEGLRLIADVRDAAGNFVTDRTLELTAHDPDLGPVRIPVQRDGPALFSAIVPHGRYGQPRQFAWRLAGVPDAPAAEADLTTPFGIIESYSPEFRTLGPSAATLEEIRRRTPDRVHSVGSAPLALGDRKGTRPTPLWPVLLVGALLLVPLDILVRRLG